MFVPPGKTWVFRKSFQFVRFFLGFSVQKHQTQNYDGTTKEERSIKVRLPGDTHGVHTCNYVVDF